MIKLVNSQILRMNDIFGIFSFTDSCDTNLGGCILKIERLNENKRNHTIIFSPFSIPCLARSSQYDLNIENKSNSECFMEHRDLKTRSSYKRSSEW